MRQLRRSAGTEFLGILKLASGRACPSARPSGRRYRALSSSISASPRHQLPLRRIPTRDFHLATDPSAGHIASKAYLLNRVLILDCARHAATELVGFGFGVDHQVRLIRRAPRPAQQIIGIARALHPLHGADAAQPEQCRDYVHARKAHPIERSTFNPAGQRKIPGTRTDSSQGLRLRNVPCDPCISP